MRMLSLKKIGYLLAFLILTTTQAFAGLQHDAIDGIQNFADDLNVILLSRNPEVTSPLCQNEDLISAYVANSQLSAAQLEASLSQLAGLRRRNWPSIARAFNQFRAAAEDVASRGVVVDNDPALRAAADNIIEQFHRLDRKKFVEEIFVLTLIHYMMKF